MKLPLTFTAIQLREIPFLKETSLKPIVKEATRWANAIKRSDKIPQYVVSTYFKELKELALRSNVSIATLHSWEVEVTNE